MEDQKKVNEAPMGELSDEQMKPVAGGWTMNRDSEECAERFLADSPCYGSTFSPCCDHYSVTATGESYRVACNKGHFDYKSKYIPSADRKPSKW